MNRMATLRTLLPAGFVFFLAGCGVFFAPFQGRWNLADPDNTLDFKELIATSDGYVTNPPPAIFSGNYLKLDSSSRVLLNFDTSQIPEDFQHAAVGIFLNSVVTPSFPIRARVILGSWNEVSVSWDQLYSDGFLTDLSSPSVPLSSMGWYYLDVTDILQGMLLGSVQGILIEPEGTPTYSANFEAAESALNQPRLVVWYPQK